MSKRKSTAMLTEVNASSSSSLKTMDSSGSLDTSSSSSSSSGSKVTFEQLLKTVLVPIAVGLVFGAALQLGRVQEFYFVRRQFIMRNFLMLKMFLTACASGMLAITALSLIPSTLVSSRLEKTSSWLTTDFNRGLPAVIVGTALVGVGMPLGGSCPGTVFAQIGAGSTKSGLIVAGAILGAILFALLEAGPLGRYFTAFLEWRPLSAESSRLDKLLKVPRVPLALFFAAFMIGIVAALEYYFPWQSDLEALIPANEARYPYAIPPYISGIAIGLLEIPLIIFVTAHLGTSTAYCTFAATMLFFVKSKTVNACRSSNAWWQVFLVAGMILGALISSTAVDAPYRSDPLLSNWEAIIGGLVLSFGSRIASGCTSGHGITGMGYLSTYSLVGTASMFGVATAVGFIFYWPNGF